MTQWGVIRLRNWRDLADFTRAPNIGDMDEKPIKSTDFQRLFLEERNVEIPQKDAGIDAPGQGPEILHFSHPTNSMDWATADLLHFCGF